MAINKSEVVLPSAVRTATNSTVKSNADNTGVHLIFDVTSVPGTDTVQVAIEGINPVDGSAYTILEGTATAATTTQILKVFPGAPVAANSSANDMLPKNWRVTVTHSAGSNFTYSVGVQLV